MFLANLSYQRECGAARSSHRFNIIVRAVAMTVAGNPGLRFFATKSERQFKRIREANVAGRQSGERDATINPDVPRGAEGAKQQSDS